MNGELNPARDGSLSTGRVLDDAAALFEATGIESRAKRVGDLAPDAILMDAQDKPVRLADLWKQAPLVLVFFRGGWCSYCNVHLRRWQQHLGELMQLGANLIAISPQSPENTEWTSSGNGLEYRLLSDSELTAANGFDIAFTLPAELIDLYASVGTNVPILNGNGQWVLPVPATYVIDQAGRIRYAHVEADYRRRAEPDHVISAVQAIVQSHDAGVFDPRG
ncbi:peroxiredoxin-like family protein [Variovorax sp. LjRoot175]|uniref:peroxiredoxin-like family protein n=1 Tax=Variovorax sp. LjRoot175 TaxID=3342276 RepID=UPI003F516720